MQYSVISEKSGEQPVVTGTGGAISSIIPDLGTTSVVLSWTKSSDPDTAYYYVFYSNDSIGYTGTDLMYVGDTNPSKPVSPIIVPVVGNTDPEFNSESPSITITGLVVGSPYWFGIKAIDGQGRQSLIVEIMDINERRINLTPKAASENIDIRIPNNLCMVIARTTKGVVLTWQRL